MELITHCEQQINEKKKEKKTIYQHETFCTSVIYYVQSTTGQLNALTRQHCIYIFFLSFIQYSKRKRSKAAGRQSVQKIIIITIITASCRFTQEYSRHVNNVQVQSVAMIITVKRNYAERLALRRSRGFARGCGKPGSYERAKHAKRGLWSDSLPRLGVEKF